MKLLQYIRSMSTGGKTNKEKQQKRWRSWCQNNTFTLCSLPVNNKGSLNCKCNLSITPYCCEFCGIYLVKMRINKAWALGTAIKTQKGCSGKYKYRASTFKFIISLMKDKWLPGWKQVSKTYTYMAFEKLQSKSTDEAEASTMILLHCFFKLNLQAREDPHQ